MPVDRGASLRVPSNPRVPTRSHLITCSRDHLAPTLRLRLAPTRRAFVRRALLPTPRTRASCCSNRGARPGRAEPRGDHCEWGRAFGIPSTMPDECPRHAERACSCHSPVWIMSIASAAISEMQSAGVRSISDVRWSPKRNIACNCHIGLLLECENAGRGNLPQQTSHTPGGCTVIWLTLKCFRMNPIGRRAATSNSLS